MKGIVRPNMSVREGFPKKGTVERRLEGDGEEIHMDLWERTFQAEVETSVK